MMSKNYFILTASILLGAITLSLSICDDFFELHPLISLSVIAGSFVLALWTYKYFNKDQATFRKLLIGGFLMSLGLGIFNVVGETIYDLSLSEAMEEKFIDQNIDRKIKEIGNGKIDLIKIQDKEEKRFEFELSTVLIGILVSTLLLLCLTIVCALWLRTDK